MAEDCDPGKPVGSGVVEQGGGFRGCCWPFWPLHVLSLLLYESQCMFFERMERMSEKGGGRMGNECVLRVTSRNRVCVLRRKFV